MALAQGSPSMDDLIKSLKPRAGGPTRGIRPTAPLAAEPAPAPAAAAAPSRPAATNVPTQHAAIVRPAPVPETSGQGMANLTVQFETGSDRLTPAATTTLDTLGRALSHSDLSAYKFQIVGHTDLVGRPEANQLLSERRAAAVTTYLVNHFHIDRGRLELLGKGEAEPVVQTPDGVAEPRNRRVQVINLGS